MKEAVRTVRPIAVTATMLMKLNRLARKVHATDAVWDEDGWLLADYLHHLHMIDQAHSITSTVTRTFLPIAHWNIVGQLRMP